VFLGYGRLCCVPLVSQQISLEEHIIIGVFCVKWDDKLSTSIRQSTYRDVGYTDVVDLNPHSAYLLHASFATINHR